MFTKEKVVFAARHRQIIRLKNYLLKIVCTKLRPGKVFLRKACALSRAKDLSQHNISLVF